MRIAIRKPSLKGLESAAKPHVPKPGEKELMAEVKPGHDRYAGGVFLIRHANTAMNRPETGKELIRGHLDPPLDKGGKTQSNEIAQHAAKSINPQAIVSSDLQRATHTADKMAEMLGVDSVKTPSLRPWDLGELQGKPTDDAADVIAEHAEPENRDKPIKGGESFNSFSGRFLGALKTLMSHYEKTGESVAAVTHYRGLKLAQSWLDDDQKGFNLKTFASNDTPTGSIMRIFPKGEKWDYEMDKGKE